MSNAATMSRRSHGAVTRSSTTFCDIGLPTATGVAAFCYSSALGSRAADAFGNEPTTFLRLVKPVAGPREFEAEDPEPDGNDEKRRPRQHEHRNADRQNREAQDRDRNASRPFISDGNRVPWIDTHAAGSTRRKEAADSRRSRARDVP